MEPTDMKASFSALLTTLFIGLKLTHVITWSWLWVLSPLWITLILAVIFWFAIVGLVASRTI